MAVSGMQTVGKLEACVSEAVTKMHRELFGKGPSWTKAYVLGEMVVVRLGGVLTVEEQHLVKTEKGRQVVKMMRQVLRESFAAELEEMIAELTGCGVISSHSDISTKTGERVEVFILDQEVPVRG